MPGPIGNASPGALNFNFINNRLASESADAGAAKGAGAGSGVAASAGAGQVPDASMTALQNGIAGLVKGGSNSAPFDPAAAERLQETVAMLRSTSSDSLDELARMQIIMAGLQKKSASMDSMAAHNNVMNHMLSQAGDLEKQMKTEMKAAVTELCIGVVTTGLSMAGSAGTLKKELGSAEKDLKLEMKAVRKELAANKKELTGLDGIESKLGKIMKSQNQLAGLVKELKSEKKTEAALEQLKNSKELGQSAGAFAGKAIEQQGKATEVDQKYQDVAIEMAKKQEDMAKTNLDSAVEAISQTVNWIHDMLEAQNEGMAALTRA